MPESGKCECRYEEGKNAHIEDALHPGTIVGACYQIGAVLGKGGFGITYKAFDLNMQKVVAIKEFFPKGMVTREGFHSRAVNREKQGTEVLTLTESDRDVYRKCLDLFYREAKALGRLSSQPNIVHAHHVFPENGTAYIVMDFVEGRSLKSIIEETGKIPEQDLLPLLDPLLTALVNVHEAGILHRDIAPDNIMVDGGVSILLDFGAARVDEGHKSSLVIGKKGYSSPEQVAGNDLDRRSDIYSMGATYYKALSGITPQDSVKRMMDDQVIPLRELDPEISPAVSDAVMKAMAIKPEDRWSVVSEFQNALKGTVSHDPDSSTERLIPSRISPVRDRAVKAVSAVHRVGMKSKSVVHQLHGKAESGFQKLKALFFSAVSISEEKKGAVKISAVILAVLAAVLLILWKSSDKRGTELTAPFLLPGISDTVTDPQKQEEYTERGKFFYEKADYENAFPLFREAADQGDAEAQYYLGLMYAEGLGVEQSYEKAAEWFQQSADQEFAKAQRNLGYLYENGYGVEKSAVKAVEWYLKAIAQGDSEAEKNLRRLEEFVSAAADALKPAAEMMTETVRVNKSVLMYTSTDDIPENTMRAVMQGELVTVLTSEQTSAGKSWIQVRTEKDNLVGWIDESAID